MNSRFWVLFFFFFSVFCSHHAHTKQLALDVRAECAILINADTGQVLYEKNSHTPTYPASITKIATASYILSKYPDKLNDVVVADAESLGWVTEEAKKKAGYQLPAYKLEPGSTHMGIKKGEELTVKELLYGLMVVSANDSANVLAAHVGGTIPSFMNNLNIYLAGIGCQDTLFLNPHGLFHPNHVTTASDMAIMTREALKNPSFREIVCCVRHARPKTNKQDSVPLLQSNKLLRSGKFYYPKAIGVKTGYTAIAQNTIVAAAKQDDRTLIAVLLKTKERNDMFEDAIMMFEKAFKQPKVEKILLKAGPQSIIRDLEGGGAPTNTYIAEDVKIDYFPAEEPMIRCMLAWDEVTLPIHPGQKVGDLVFETDAGQEIKRVPLLATDRVDAAFSAQIAQFFGTFEAPGLGIKISGILLICVFLFVLGRFLVSRR